MMDLASKLALARKAKQLKSERRKNAQAARTRGQLMQRLAAGSGASSRGESPSSSVSDLHNSVPAVVLANMVAIIIIMLALSFVLRTTAKLRA